MYNIPAILPDSYSPIPIVHILISVAQLLYENHSLLFKCRVGFCCCRHVSHLDVDIFSLNII